jgi:glyoxylase-like metal-dependent hydrolase (beta-lactamase superfamily II)
MTLEGTNTWILREVDASSCVVIDPGPDDPVHLQAIAEAIDGVRVTHILLTHGHSDHSEGARALGEQLSAPVAALDPSHRYGSEGIHGGEVVESGGLTIEVLSTPGHTADSLSFFVPADSALLTGDTVLGRGTTMVAYPDGNLGAYLDSLASLKELALKEQVAVLLPGHGQALPNPAAVIDTYQHHRRDRLDQVRTALAQGAVTAQDVVEIVYADVPRELWPAAVVSVQAQLAYLRDRD